MKNEVGRISKNPYQDVIVFCALYRGHPYVHLQTLPAGADAPEDPEHPRILSLSPRTVEELLPLLAQARTLAVKLGDDAERGLKS